MEQKLPPTSRFERSDQRCPPTQTPTQKFKSNFSTIWCGIGNILNGF